MRAVKAFPFSSQAIWQSAKTINIIEWTLFFTNFHYSTNGKSLKMAEKLENKRKQWQKVKDDG